MRSEKTCRSRGKRSLNWSSRGTAPGHPERWQDELDGQQEAIGIRDDGPLATIEALASVKSAWPAGLRRRSRLAVDNGSRGFGLRPSSCLASRTGSDDPVPSARACWRDIRRCLKGSAAFLGNTEAAVDAGLEPSHGSGPDEEFDDYDRLLASFGRTRRCSDRHSRSGARGLRACAGPCGRRRDSINPDPVRGFEGLCWGAGHEEAFAEGRGAAFHVWDALRSVMPQAGEDRRPVADVFGNVYAKCHGRSRGGAYAAR
ncbi:hypothetical protein ABIF29_005478 [Bradyrhizobium elkanii]|jgi:hypothetical protein|uniref:Uncharacterized protein n=1 Tax=Bradyrhizobium elkanii TaxID=29448 RepID=A0ABV4F6C9_BRAEL